MVDPAWHDVFRATQPHVRPTDSVLAPRANWPDFPCRLRLYDGPIELGDATVLLLHKGRLAGMRRDVLAGIVRDWTCIHANDVFAAYSRAGPRGLRAPNLSQHMHLLPVERYLNARRNKRRRGTIYFLHIPKAGGTSLWTLLRRAFPSHVYYGDLASWIANSPEPGAFDLVGLHFPASVLKPLLRDDDDIVGMLRHPTERFLSSVAHARRPTEDPATFTSAMQAMRTMPLAAFLATEDGRQSIRLQLVTLGADHRRPFSEYRDTAMLEAALAQVDHPRACFAASDQSARFVRMLSRRFGFRAKRLGQMNATPAGLYADCAEEFNQARPLIERENVLERALYARVRDRFKA
jgi:hypothetical protein